MKICHCELDLDAFCQGHSASLGFTVTSHSISAIPFRDSPVADLPPPLDLLCAGCDSLPVAVGRLLALALRVLRRDAALSLPAALRARFLSGARAILLSRGGYKV